ncbi:CGNR zinc finger domain-containing protein [Microtetraspora malaysiensis]
MSIGLGVLRTSPAPRRPTCWGRVAGECDMRGCGNRAKAAQYRARHAPGG